MRAATVFLVSLFASVVPTSALHAQAADTLDGLEGHRSPGLARSLSIVPGLGHAYAGSPLRGLAFTAAFLGAGAVAAFTVSECFTILGESDCEEEAELLMVVAVVAVPLVWIATAVDAGHVAKRRNRTRAASLTLGVTRVPTSGGDASALKVGVRLSR